MDASRFEWDDKYVLHTYGRAPLCSIVARASHRHRRQVYLDFVSGIAVNALGYGDEEVCSSPNRPTR